MLPESTKRGQNGLKSGPSPPSTLRRLNIFRTSLRVKVNISYFPDASAFRQSTLRHVACRCGIQIKRFPSDSCPSTGGNVSRHIGGSGEERKRGGGREGRGKRSDGLAALNDPATG